MSFFSHSNKNVSQQLKEIFSSLEKDYVKAIILLDEKGAELYSYPERSFFHKKDLQGFLNLFSYSEKIINQSFDDGNLIVFRNFLNYFVSSIIVKFGTYRIYLANNKKFFLLCMLDEGIKANKIEKVEKTLIRKLEELKERKLIEDY